MSDLEARVVAIEDRFAISDRITLYAQALDRSDWELFRECICDPIRIDFRDSTGMEVRDWRAEEWTAFAAEALTGFEAKQHLSPNHLISIDGDRAVASSYMFAQHHLPGAPGGDTFIMRGSYTTVLVRTNEGWKFRELTQHFNWGTGNQEIFESSRERYLRTKDN